MLELQQFERSFLHKRFHRVLVSEPVAAGDGVVGVFIQSVILGEHASGPALG